MERDGPAVLGERSAFSDYATVMGARALYALLSLAAVTFSTRLLRPGQFGSLSLFFVMSLLIVTAASSWTSAAVSRFGREELDRHGRMSQTTSARAVFVLPLLALAVPAVLGLQAAGALPSAFSRTLALLSVGYAAIWVCFDHVVYLLETWGRQKLSALVLLVQQAAYVSTLAALYVSGARVSAAEIAVVVMAGMALMTIVISVVVRDVGFAARRPGRDQVRRMWGYSSPLIAFVISQYVIRSIDLVVIGTFRSAAAVGAYALAYQGFGTIQTIATTAGPVFTPLLVSLRLAGRRSAIGVFVDRIVLKLGFCAAVCVGLAMGPLYGLMPAIFGPGYGSARIPLVLLLGASAVFFQTSFLGCVVAVFDRTRDVARINIYAAVSNVALDFILVGWAGAGIWAPAVATTVSIVLVWMTYERIAARSLELPFRLRISWLGPVAAGLIPLLVLSSSAAPIISVCAAAAASIVGFLYGPEFRRADVQVIESLDVPIALRRAMLRLLRYTKT